MAKSCPQMHSDCVGCLWVLLAGLLGPQLLASALLNLPCSQFWPMGLSPVLVFAGGFLLLWAVLVGAIPVRLRGPRLVEIVQGSTNFWAFVPIRQQRFGLIQASERRGLTRAERLIGMLERQLALCLGRSQFFDVSRANWMTFSDSAPLRRSNN